MNSQPLESGRYIIAVSGGVDSIVLLHLLCQQADIALVVAHFDHGMRKTSADDATFVQELARKYGLTCIVGHGNLGEKASEATARKARYAFLHQIMQQEKARAIITAHHQDDILETTIINLNRGTGWRGICSLRSTKTLLRPLRDVTKKEIIAYARSHGLPWHEDETNTDQRYLRNHIRREIMPKFRNADRQELLALITRQQELRQEIEAILKEITDPFCNNQSSATIPRTWLIMLPRQIAKEVLLAVIYKLTRKRVERSMLKRMIWFVCTARVHATLQIRADLELYSQKRTVVVRTREIW